MTDEPRHPPAARRTPDRTGGTAEFEGIYRLNVAAVTAYFARRTTDPQLAADLTADTFVAAITSFGTFDPTRGSARGWLFGVARHVFARHCATTQRDRDAVARLGGHRQLSVDESAELLVRIDAERAGRALLDELAALSPADREVVELVDIAGLTPREAAAAVGVSSGALRIRLFRVRTRLRTLLDHNQGGKS